MNIPTLKQLNSFLIANTTVKPVTRKNCETYGTKTFAYLACRDMTHRALVESMLITSGKQVSPGYCRATARHPKINKPIVEVRVSYLRAFGWDK